MPEIKRNFTKGKMNKDLDERIVPLGEYRDAQNIQVSTSESSDVGAVENILGNSMPCDYSGTYLSSQLSNPIPVGATTVGSIADEKNDTLYWLVSGHNTGVTPDWGSTTTLKDIIMRTNSNAIDGSGCEPVFVDTYAFSTAYSGNLNVNQLNVSGTLFGQIEKGWTVTGVTSGGSTSNTAVVDYLSHGQLIMFSYEVVPLTIPTLGPMMGLSMGGDWGGMPPCHELWVEGINAGGIIQDASSSTIYISSCNWMAPSIASEYIGAEITINPDAAGIGVGGNPQTFTVTAASDWNEDITNGFDPSVSGFKLVLDQAIVPFTPFIPSGDFQLGPLTGKHYAHLWDLDGNGSTNVNDDLIASHVQYLLPPGTTDSFSGNMLVWGATDPITGAPNPNPYNVTDFNIGDSLVVGIMGADDTTMCVDSIDIVNNSITMASPHPTIPGTCSSDGPLTLSDNALLMAGYNVARHGQMYNGNEIYANLDTTLNLALETFTSLIWQGPRVLNFNNNNLITGINIVDDMLYWTDGYYDSSNNLLGSEPKKINIPRSVQGTFYTGETHTQFENPSRNLSKAVKEEHITVMKKSPLSSPTLNMVGQREGNSYGTTSFAFSNSYSINDEIEIVLGSATGGDLNYKVGDVLFLKTDSSFGSGSSSGLYPVTQPEVRLIIEEISGFTYTCSIVSISDTVTNVLENYAADLDKSYEKLYRLKFPRFALRYKYQDGEYSTYGPFSEPAFIPGDYDYLPNKGYNLGMQNQLRELTLNGIVPGNIPDGVVQVDILYKESDSPNVYIVDEIVPTDIYWSSNSYLISEETIKSVLPSNQLLRPWDNVPKKALSQEVTGNRIVYGNYLQNYSLYGLRPSFTTTLRPRAQDSTYKSIKSIRDYQLGVVYCDQYNRQTPVLSDASASISVAKLNSSTPTQIEIKPLNSPPPWATHHKFYIKDTYSEYYNLSLDRYFDAKDDNVWLAFPSNDRNKLDLDTSLHLKKRYKSNDAELSNEVYKIIDIKNEAPEYIKTRKSILGRAGQDTGSNVLFDQTDLIPVEGAKEFRINQGALENTILQDIHKRHNSPGEDGLGGGALNNGPLFLRLLTTDLSGNITGEQTDWYEIDNITKKKDGFHYEVRIKKPFEADAAWVHNSDPVGGGAIGDPDFLLGGVSNASDNQISLEIAQEIIQNKALFQGRFFAKILKDQAINEAIFQQGEFADTTVLKTAEAGYLKDFSENDLSMGDVWDGYYTSTAHEDAINDMVANGWPHNCFNSGIHGGYPCYANAAHNGKPYTDNEYWSWYVWQKIYADLTEGGSRWVIDEAFATGEEPYWGKFGGSYDDEHVHGANYLNHEVTGSFPNQVSTTYGGYHFASANDFTRDHNANSTVSQGSLPSVPGLAHGTDTSSYEYFSEGHGVKNDYIDLSYVGTGRADFNAGTTSIDWTDQAEPTLNNWQAIHTQCTYWRDYWKISGSNGNLVNNNDIGDAMDTDAKIFADLLTIGNHIRFKEDTSGPSGNPRIYKIKNVEKFYKLNYSQGLYDIDYPFSVHGAIYNGVQYAGTGLFDFNYVPYGPNWSKWYHKPHFNRRITFRLYLEDIVTGGSPADNLGNFNPLVKPVSGNNIDLTSTNRCPIEIVSQNYTNDNDIPFPENPAVFETEPKTSEGVDIFHEISDTLPINVKNYGDDFAPIGSIVTCKFPGFISGGKGVVVGWEDDVCKLDVLLVDDFAGPNMLMYFTRPDGTYTTAKYYGLGEPIIPGPSDTSNYFKVDADVKNNKVGLGWHNCYAYGNGVESNRIRDTFNSVYIDKGPKVSTTLSDGYKEEHRKYGLIYSGLYNSTSGVNNLNQFIAAEKITKDINPTYGSIQKLKAGWGQGGDLITLCEDRVLKILANKDALFNADGNTNVTSTNKVLGQAIPYSGEYGISKNPESFASEAYRAYFTDKVRGAVMRLSMDGLTPISTAGMKDWFRDNLKLSNKLIGSYDDRKQEYNITLEDNNKTVTYREDVKGWVSFKSFVPENGLSCANEYYTIKEGNLWRHHNETVNRNTFYNTFYPSSINVIINDMPGSIKTFHTLNYEGSQSRVNSIQSSAMLQDKYDIWDVTSWNGTFDANGIPNYTNSIGEINDKNYYNLSSSSGWFVNTIETDKEVGTLNEFIEKEGKWFNYIRGKAWQQ